MVFNPTYRLKLRIFNRLKKFANIKKQRREQNMRALQYFLVKHQSVPLTKWLGKFRFRRVRAQKLSNILKKLVNRRRQGPVARFEKLVYDTPFYNKFAIEREYFIYSIKNQEFEMKLVDI